MQSLPSGLIVKMPLGYPLIQSPVLSKAILEFSSAFPRNRKMSLSICKRLLTYNLTNSGQRVQKIKRREMENSYSKYIISLIHKSKIKYSFEQLQNRLDQQ